MIKVTVGNNTKREDIIVNANTTLRQALDQAGVSFTSGTTNLNGTPVCHDELDDTFADFGITDRCYLLSVAKADNAA